MIFTSLELLFTTVPLWNQVIESGAGNPMAVHDKKKGSDKVGVSCIGFTTNAGPTAECG